MNPRRPMPTGPKPVSFDQTRTPPLLTGTRPFRQDVKGRILTLLVKLKAAGLADLTLRSYRYRLNTLAEHVNLDDPEEVAKFIANIDGSSCYKESFVKAYSHYAGFYGLSWRRPRYRIERKVPRIPAGEDIDKIIARSTWKYATIFTLLKEAGAMPCELSDTTMRDIDFERGLLHIRGRKGHASRALKLKPSTIAMLKTYIAKHNGERLFPTSKAIEKAWTRLRNELAVKLQNPVLKTIRLYDLRHYFATMLYHKTKDILYTKQQMGHKKIETTLIYTQLFDFGEEEWTSAVAKSVEEACRLVDAGFEYVCDFEGAKIFRKRK